MKATVNLAAGFILLNPVYFRRFFCLSQDLDTALPPLTSGTLCLVAPPICNLEDITFQPGIHSGP